MSRLTADLNDHLRNEKAWSEVAGGLGKVLIGYAALVAGWMVAAGFFYACLAPLLANKQPKIEHLWYFYIGVATLKITGLASWGLILAGQWRCLMNSPERNGARWVMFFCMTCVVMGPVLHFLAWFGGLQTPIKWTGGPQAIHAAKIKFTMMGLYVMAASLVTSLGYKLSFWYYLQTVSGCVGASKARTYVWMFFLIVGGMAAFTGWWFFGRLHINKFTDLAPWVAAGWVAVAFYWVSMIVVVKVAIEQAMAEVFNPMQAAPARSHFQVAGS